MAGGGQEWMVMAAVTPDAFGSAGYVDPYDRVALGWRQQSIRMANTTSGDTWTSSVRIRRIAFVRASATVRSCTPILSADGFTVTFNSDAAMTTPRFMVWY